jgi:hypothetical protein
MTDKVLERLFALVQTEKTEPDVALFTGMNDDDWDALYRRSAAEGVLALAFDSMLRLPTDLRPPKKLLMIWGGSVDHIEQKYALRLAIAKDVAARLGEHNIPMLVIKGLSLAQYHSNPAHREFGDLDIYLFGEQKKGDQVMRQWNTKELLGSKKHSMFYYKGLLIENHAYFLESFNISNMKALDAELQQMANAERGNVSLGKPAFPSADFTLVFFMHHALAHYMRERLKLRYFCDWAIFLHANRTKSWDWTLYETMFPRGGNRRKTVDAFTAIAVRWLGLPQHEAPPFERDEAFETEILNELSIPALQLPVKQPFWKVIAFKYKRFVGYRQKCEFIAAGSFRQIILNSICYHIRHPKTIWSLKK